jgi:outer membrane receptor protein involved in Fe transport
LGFKVDLSSQVTKGNFVKTGVEFITSSIDMIHRFDSSPGARGLLLIANEGQIGDPVKPFFLNAYVQDKMEFQGMIVNLGLRMDSFNPNTKQLTFGAYRGAPMFRYYTRARDWAYQDGSVWTTDAPWHVRFSPRVGISHPITERSQMRFSTGVFLQWADLWYYFGEDYWTEAEDTDRDINGNNRIDETERYNSFFTTYSGQNGLALLQPAKTTAFEVGADWNFVSDYTGALTAYYKSEVDHFTSYPNETWQGPTDSRIRYSRTLDNGAHGDTRGMELSVRKAFSHNFSFNVSYNYQWSQITTGKRGNVIRNVYMDSATTVRMATTTAYTDGGVNVPNYWVFFDAGADGREIPKALTGADLVQYATMGQNSVNSSPKFGALLGTGIYEGLIPIMGPAADQGVQILTGSYTTLFASPKSGDRRNFGSASLLASFPDDFQFGHALVSNLFKNMRINMTTRIETGTIFNYAPPDGGNSFYQEQAMDSRTDLAIEKTFNVAGRLQPTLFADIRNLFNQKDRSSASNANLYNYIGLDGPEPDNSKYLQYGDSRDRTYAHTPRLVHFGLRLNW